MFVCVGTAVYKKQETCLRKIWNGLCNPQGTVPLLNANVRKWWIPFSENHKCWKRCAAKVMNRVHFVAKVGNWNKDDAIPKNANVISLRTGVMLLRCHDALLWKTQLIGNTVRGCRVSNNNSSIFQQWCCKRSSIVVNRYWTIGLVRTHLHASKMRENAGTFCRWHSKHSVGNVAMCKVVH